MDLCDRLSEQDRLLPGLCLSFRFTWGTEFIKTSGPDYCFKYLGKQIDAVMTVATKGVPIAQAVSYYLNVPFVIVRRDSKITEGSTVSVNYVSGLQNVSKNGTFKTRLKTRLKSFSRG